MTDSTRARWFRSGACDGANIGDRRGGGVGARGVGSKDGGWTSDGGGGGGWGIKGRGLDGSGDGLRNVHRLRGHIGRKEVPN